ncbi:hypothetical protein EJB05_48646, partial [Eragrostis curvula]
MASGGDPWEYSLRKYLMLLATLVATVTYTAGFNPPGGVWQDTDAAAGHLAGDPIIRSTSYRRYLTFFYSNATAFASSLVVIVLVLILAVLHERRSTSLAPLCILRLVMVLDLLSLMGAYAAGTCRDRLTAAYSSALVAGVVVYLLVHLALSSSRCSGDANATATDADAGSSAAPERHRKVLMLLATFAVSVTYLAGLSAPGGFWDDQGVGDGHRPGDAVLKGGRPDARLKAFFVCNTTAFVASLLILVLLLEKKLRYSVKVRSFELYGFIVVALVGLVVAYSAGSGREVDTTIYVNSLIAAVLVCILIQVVIVKYFKDASGLRNNYFWKKLERMRDSSDDAVVQPAANGGEKPQVPASRALEKARSLVLLLATLAAAITYQAGLSPPGGLWQDAGAGYKAGDPILLTTNPRRYKAFYYCNSVAFVASVVVIVLVRRKTLHQHNALEAAMVLDLIGLVGAYATGSCRDVNSSVHAVGLGGAVLVYVVIHVILFTLDRSAMVINDDGEAASLEKRRKRLLLFAILAATITYQAGLTPPSGFLLKDDEASGHRAGDPVLLHNYPRRYKAFFYCNSVSFMLSIALIMILVNPNVYRPAIRSNALSSQGRGKGVTCEAKVPDAAGDPCGDRHLPGRPGAARRSVAESDGGGHAAGDPVMHDNRRPRYLAFFYSNSTSFVASIVVIILLLPEPLQKEKWWLGVMNAAVVLDLLGLLVAYAAGSGRSWRTSAKVSALVVGVLAYFVIHVVLSCFSRRGIHLRLIPVNAG